MLIQSLSIASVRSIIISFVRSALQQVVLLANESSSVAFRRTNKIHAKRTKSKLRGKGSVSCYNSDRLLLVSLPQQCGERRDSSLKQVPGELHRTSTT